MLFAFIVALNFVWQIGLFIILIKPMAGEKIWSIDLRVVQIY
jgi:hypothetical protein